MTFSVQSAGRGIEYNGASLNALFAQRRNILSPPFYRMVRDILRFNQEAPRLLEGAFDDTRLGEYLNNNGYSPEFGDLYLVPMAAAIWSAQPDRIWDMPVHFLVRFFRNHGLLQLRDRPVWRTIDGGSREYVRKLVDGHRDRIRLSTPVRSLRRIDGGVLVMTDRFEAERFDYVVLACHSDQALHLLADPTPAETDVLSAIEYQENEAILHTDENVLPRRRRCWAAWNYHIPRDIRKHAVVSYNMNILQGFHATQQFCVTLNDTARIAPGKIIRRFSYHHPVFCRESIDAQARQRDLNTGRRTFYCGAYWRNGFHEDGVVSALKAVRDFEEALQNEKLHIRRAG
jgi:predicted NAD/FAD-binding protein